MEMHICSISTQIALEILGPNNDYNKLVSMTYEENFIE